MTCAHEGIAAWALHRLLRVPYVVVCHGTDVRLGWVKYLRRTIMMRVLGNAAFLVPNSAYIKRTLKEYGLSSSHIVVVHPPVPSPEPDSRVDVASLKARYGLSGHRVLFTASRLVPREGHALVLEVLASLRNDFPDLCYIMTGDGPYRVELDRLAEHFAVRDMERMAGNLATADLYGLYLACDICVSPGIGDGHEVEGFGIALVEASARGKPVIK